MRAFDNCLVCGDSTENTHSARRGSDALVCGGDCYRQASRNFKRNMSGYKVARLVDLLVQIGGPVTAAQLLARYRDTYGKSAMMGFNNTNAVTQQLMPIVNPETIRVDKTKNPFTFEYLGGTTIGEWLKPSMRAKYESVSFRSETFEAEVDNALNWEILDSLEVGDKIDLIVKRSGRNHPSFGREEGMRTTTVKEILDGLPSSHRKEVAYMLNPYYREAWKTVETLSKHLKKIIIFDNGETILLLDRPPSPNPDSTYCHFYFKKSGLRSGGQHNWDNENKYRRGLIVGEIKKSETFAAESDSYEWEWDRTDYAPTELIKKRLKNAGFSMTSVGTTYKDQIVEFYEPQLVALNGVVLEVCLSQNEEFDGFSRLTFYEQDHSGDVGKTPDIDWDVLHEKGLLKGEDSVEQPQGDYYQVYWDGLYNEWKNGQQLCPFNCADNAKFDIYEDNFVVMECVECGRTATFEQTTPYEGPRNAETFGAEEDEEELKQYSVTVPVLHYYSFEPVEAYDEDEAVDEVRNNWGHWRRTIEDNGDWGGPLWRYDRLSSHDPEAYEILDSETFGSESQQEVDVSVGDRVRSYDFVLPDGTLIRDDCYMEGRVTKIAPVDWCGSECDHYYILVDRVVRNGEELSERKPGVDMVYPPVSESYLEIISKRRSGNMEEMDAETEEYKGPFEVEIRRPDGSKASWKKYENYRQLIDALEDIVSNRYTPYAIDVFATNVPYISGFTTMGPVTDYRKFHLATWKYGNWESGPWAEHLPSGLE